MHDPVSRDASDRGLPLPCSSFAHVGRSIPKGPGGMSILLTCWYRRPSRDSRDRRKPAGSEGLPSRSRRLKGNRKFRTLQYGHSPPTSFASTPVTCRPARASFPAASSPGGACRPPRCPSAPHSSGSPRVMPSSPAPGRWVRPYSDVQFRVVPMLTAGAARNLQTRGQTSRPSPGPARGPAFLPLRAGNSQVRPRPRGTGPGRAGVGPAERR